MMAYYADLGLTYLRLLLKTWLQMRLDLVVTVLSQIIGTGARLVFLTVIFANIRQLQGWSFGEVLMIWGLTTTGSAIAGTVLDVPHRIDGYIRRGDFDRLLTRPPAPIFQIAGESGLTLPAVSRVLIGVAAIVTSWNLTPYPLAWWAPFYLVLAIMSGTLLMFSVQLILACLCFWFISTFSLMQTLAWMHQFGQYPVTILALPLQFVFTWVLPYAMMGFYPAAFLLRGDEYRFFGLLAPLMGWVFLGLALRVWETAMQHYQSTGS